MGFTLYGLLAALAMASLLGVSFLAGYRRGVTYGSIIRFAVLALPLSFVLSRVVYCLSSISYYFETTGHPELMLQVRDGGYTMLGAMLGVILAAVLTARWQKIHVGAMLDTVAVGMPVALIIARLAEAHRDMGWGYQYTSPVFSFLDNLCDSLHPVFAYEAIAAALILAVLLVIRRMACRGDVFLSFLLLYGCTQTVLESMLDTNHMMVLFVHISQVAALLMALLPLILWSIRYPRSDRSAKLRLASAWALAIASIASALVQEINVTGADRTAAIAPFVPLLLGAAMVFWCVMWRKAGLARLIPAIIASVLACAAIIIDQTELVGDHYLLALWGIMALDMFLLCWTGFALRAAAQTNINE